MQTRTFSNGQKVDLKDFIEVLYAPTHERGIYNVQEY